MLPLSNWQTRLPVPKRGRIRALQRWTHFRKRLPPGGFLQKLSTMSWPHAPKPRLFEPGIYMVTAGTYQKLPHLNSPARLYFLPENFVPIRRRISLVVARVGGDGQPLPFHRRLAARPAGASQVPRQIAHEDRPGTLTGRMPRPDARCGSSSGTATLRLSGRILRGCTTSTATRRIMAWRTWRRISNGVPRRGLRGAHRRRSCRP